MKKIKPDNIAHLHRRLMQLQGLRRENYPHWTRRDLAALLELFALLEENKLMPTAKDWRKYVNDNE